MDRRLRRLLSAAGFLALLVLLVGSCKNNVNLLGKVKDEVMAATGKFLLVNQVGPVANTTNVSPGTPITIVFDRAIDSTSISAKSIVIDPPAQFTWSYNAATRTLTVTPLALDGGKTYTISITLGVRGSDGSSLQTPYSWSYSTSNVPYGTFTVKSKDGSPTGYTRQTLVQLAVSPNFQAYKMRASELQDFSDTGWVLSTISLDFTLSSGDGQKTVYMEFIDDKGTTTSDLVSRTITLDTVAPAVSMKTIPNLNIASPAASADATATDANGIAAYSWTKAAGTGTVTFGSPTSASTTVSADADGAYQVTVTVTDAAGHTAQATSPAFVRDTVAPTVSAGGDKVLKVGSLTATLAGTASDSNGITSSAWSGTGLTFTPDNNPSTAVSAAADGTYTATLTATDTYGNVATSSATIVRDVTPPVVNAGTGKVLNAASPTATITATVTEANIDSILWSGAGLTFTPNNAATTAVSGTVDGTYTATLTVTDKVGNSASSSVQVTRDVTLPVVNAGTTKLLNIAAPTAVLAGTASDVNLDTVQWSGAGLTFTPNDSVSTTVNAIADGTYTATLTATDKCGNSVSASATIVRDVTAPVVNAGAAKVLNAAAPTATITPTVTEANVDTLQWSGTGLIFTPANAAATTVSGSADGTYTATLTVTDKVGNSASSSVQVTRDTILPTVGAGADKILKVGSPTASLGGSASDSNGIASYSWSGTGLTFTPNNAATTTVSAGSDGTYTATLTVTDSYGNAASDSATITRDVAAPVVSAGTNKVLNYAAPAGTLDGSASDANLVSVQWTSTPAGLTFGTPTAATTTVSGTADGIYTATLTATDSVGNSTSSSIQVARDTVRPVVNAGPDTPLNIASPSKTLTGSATDANPVTVQWSGTGLTFGNPTSLSTTVSAGADARYTATLTATDAYGNTATDSASILKDMVAPVVNAGSAIVLNYNAPTVTRTATATDTNLAGVQWAGTGLTFGTPTAATTTISASVDGSYTAYFGASDAAGNSSQTTVPVTRDVTRPVVSAGLGKVLTIAAPTATLAGSVTEVNLASLQWTGTGLTFGTPSSTSTTVTAAADGTYTAMLTATDRVGNSVSATAQVIRDQTAPTVNAGGTVYLNFALQTKSIGSASDANGLKTVSWSTPPAPLALSTLVAVPSTASATADGGPWSVTLTATDVYGNSATSTANIYKDTVLPGTPAFNILTTVPSPTILNTPIWGWTSGGGGGGAFWVTLSTGGKPIWDDRFPTTVTQFPPDLAYVTKYLSKIYPLPDATYVFSVYETDVAGNPSATVSKTTIVSTTRNLIPPDGATAVPSPVPNFQWLPFGKQISYTLFLVDPKGARIGPTAAMPYPWYQTPITLSLTGKYTWYVVESGGARIPSATGTFSFTH